MIILEPWRQIKNSSFNRVVIKKKKKKSVFGASRSIDFDYYKDTVSWTPAESQLVKSHTRQRRLSSVSCIKLNFGSWLEEEVGLVERSTQKSSVF